MNKILTIILVIIILGSIGTLAYVGTKFKTTEKFTEFYILGHGDRAQDYPSEFTLKNNQVVAVSYGNTYKESASYGKLTVGIINHEQEETSYTLKMLIDGVQVNMINRGQTFKQLNLVLLPEEKWEQEIGFAPVSIVENQRVELFLYKDNAVKPYLDLHFEIIVS